LTRVPEIEEYMRIKTLRSILGASLINLLRVLWFVALPMQFFNLRLELVPIPGFECREKFDNIFDILPTIIRKSRIWLRFRQAEIFAFKVPIFEKFSDISTIKTESSVLSQTGHNRTAKLSAVSRRGELTSVVRVRSRHCWPLRCKIR
jgi:hypothetical protein